MPVTIMCPNLRCRKVLIVAESTRGKRVRCNYCKTMLVVPQASAGGGEETVVEAEAAEESADKKGKGKKK